MTSIADDWDEHWTAFNTAMRNFNPATRWREHLVIRSLGLLNAGESIIDIGCGVGDLVMLIKRTHPDVEVQGVDNSRAGLSIASDAAAHEGLSIEFFWGNLLESNEIDGQSHKRATRAVCSEVLEHLDDPTTFLRNARKYLAPGARLVITVPAGPRSAFERHIGHRRHFSRRRLAEILQTAGFDVISIRRAGFPFFNLYKLFVIIRGKRMMNDITLSESVSKPPFALRVLTRFFDWTLPMTIPSSPLGWQLVAIAKSAT